MPWLLAATILLVSASSAPVEAAPAARPLPDRQTVAAPAAEYVYPTDVGLLFFYVKPGRTQDFEAIVTRLGDALAVSVDPTRRQQAAGWRMFRSREHTADAPVYLFLFDPVVRGADYDPVKLLAEGTPGEVQDLYVQLRDALLRVERMSLDRLR